MRIERGFAIVMAILLMLAAALPAAADNDNNRHKVDVRGVIVAVDARSQSFLLREDQRGARFDRTWVVTIQPNTKFRVEGRGLNDRNDDWNDKTGRVYQGYHQFLRVGAFVEVEGRLVANGRILATEINFRGQVQQPSPPIAVFPPTTLPPYQQYPQPPIYGFPQQTQILYPQNGAVITTPEFTVIGRSFPYAQVRVEVSTVFTFFTFGAGSTDVTADANGFFAATIRPSVRLPGATYRITVTSQVSGYPMQPVTITVTQQ